MVKSQWLKIDKWIIGWLLSTFRLYKCSRASSRACRLFKKPAASESWNRSRSCLEKDTEPCSSWSTSTSSRSGLKPISWEPTWQRKFSRTLNLLLAQSQINQQFKIPDQFLNVSYTYQDDSVSTLISFANEYLTNWTKGSDQGLELTFRIFQPIFIFFLNSC